MPQVLFTQRSGPYWPGANPHLSDEKAAECIKDGKAIPYSDESRAKIKELLAVSAGEQLETVTIPPAKPVQTISHGPNKTDAKP